MKIQKIFSLILTNLDQNHRDLLHKKKNCKKFLRLGCCHKTASENDFSTLARILIQKNWNSFVTYPLFFKVYHLRIQLFLTADSGSVSYQNKFYGFYIWNSYVVNRSFYGKRNYLTVYLKHWSKLRHYQPKLLEIEWF